MVILPRSGIGLRRPTQRAPHSHRDRPRDDDGMAPDPADWAWDETLYAGAARYYPAGRMPYPGALALAIQAELGLDGTGKLLDVGCGPGSLTLLLAPLAAS